MAETLEEKIALKCCVESCKNTWTPSSTIGFVRFPAKLETRKIWCLAVNLDIKSITNNHVICETHFPDEQFTISINKKLRSWAIPQIIKNETICYDELETKMSLSSVSLNTQQQHDYWQESPVPEAAAVVNDSIDSQILFKIEHVRSENLFGCDMCSLQFTSRDERNTHIDNHFRSYECTVCKKSFIGDRQYEHHRRSRQCTSNQLQIDNIIYECFVCHKGHFFSIRSLKIHNRRMHNGWATSRKNNEENRCNICNKTFANVYIMRYHIDEIHKQTNRFECDVCGKKFNRLSNMTWHHLIHENKMPCTCNVCGKSFRTVSGVNLHKRMHTGEKPHKCDICNEKAYAYNTDLKRHKRSAHGIVDKEFPCSICERIFYEPKFLRKHMEKVHPPIAWTA